MACDFIAGCLGGKFCFVKFTKTLRTREVWQTFKLPIRQNKSVGCLSRFEKVLSAFF